MAKFYLSPAISVQHGADIVVMPMIEQTHSVERIITFRNGTKKTIIAQEHDYPRTGVISYAYAVEPVTEGTMTLCRVDDGNSEPDLSLATPVTDWAQLAKDYPTLIGQFTDQPSA